MLDVPRLRILRELARRGSLAAVAQAFSYTPSAISQQLAQLEKEAGVALIERVGRGVRLTHQGRLLVEHAEVILERLELAEADLSSSASAVAGTIRVASFQTVMLALIPSTLALLSEQHPALRVEVIQSEASAALEGLLVHDFDLLLGEEYPGLPGRRTGDVVERDLLLDPLRLVTPRTGPLAHRTLEQCANAPWVMDPLSTEPGQWTRNACRQAGFEPDVRFQSPDPLLHVHLVETGQAVTILPDLTWTARPSRPRLSLLPDEPRRRLFTAVRRGGTAHPAVVAFQEALDHVARTSKKIR